MFSVDYNTFAARVADKWEDVPFWSATDLQDAINESLRVWAMLTGSWRKRIVVPTVPDDPWVPIPGTMTYATRVTWRNIVLEPTSIHALDCGRRGWQGENTATVGVPNRPVCWAPAGASMIAIWPADHTGGDALTVDGIVSLDLVGPGNTIDISEPDLNILAGYALHVCAFKEGGARWKGTLPHYEMMIRAAGDTNTRLKSTHLYRAALGIDERGD